MGRSILIILMLAASPLSGAAESFSRQVDINPLPFGLTVMKGFGMGIGYEQIISGSLSWRVTFAGGTVPLDDYGDDINIAFFIPQAGFRWYPLRQGLKGWWIGSNYGLLLLYGSAEGNGMDNRSLYLLHELSLDTGVNFGFGRDSHWYGTVYLFLSWVPGGEYWGVVDGESSHLKMRGSRYLMLIPGLSLGYRY